MIIVKLIGGLGNQLFQYAAGLSLAKEHNVPLKIDLAAFTDYKLRKYDLDYFNLNVEIASEEEIQELKSVKFIDKLKNNLLSYNYRTHYKESYFHFDKSFYFLGANVYLQGYFQSEKYFIDIKELLFNQFQVKKDLIRDIEPFCNQLRNGNSVAIHVRLSDYSIHQNSAYHGTLSKDYYRQAINEITKANPDSEFYLFSDDVEKAKLIFSDLKLNIVSNTITKHFIEDFYLMSQCKHNIIANSSFSWWAAWLNPNPNKIVIAPKKWFNKGPKDTQDLFPPSWIQID